MKQKLLFLFFSILISTSLFAQTVSGGQVDTFEDTTTQFWRVGGVGFSSGPMNITPGAAVGSNFIKYTSTGVLDDPVSKMIILNTDQHWQGDFTAEGIVAIRFYVKVETNDLNLRIAFDGSGGKICTNDVKTLTVIKDLPWQLVEIEILAGDFDLVSGGTNVASTLANVTQMRILSNTSPAWVGKTIASILSLDNISAHTSLLSTKDDKLANAFSISPNPGRDRLNLKLAKLSNNATVEVFDVLGKKIYADRVNTVTKSVNVSQWNNGVYLVRLTTSTVTQTKRFVKQ